MGDYFLVRNGVTPKTNYLGPFRVSKINCFDGILKCVMYEVSQGQSKWAHLVNIQKYHPRGGEQSLSERL